MEIEPDFSFEFGPKKIASNGDVDIAYWTFGEGTPLILITGWGTPASSWSVMPQVLSEAGYEAIVIDNRDCGQSTPCEGITYEVSEMADDVVAVMDAEGIAKAYVFGISMGGMIAQELALNHPEKVEKLILAATNPGGENRIDATPETLAGIFARAVSSDPVEATAQGLGTLMGPGFAEANHETLMALARRRIEDGSDASAFMRQLDAMRTFDSWDRLPSLQMPSLVIHGDADPLVPYENGQRISSRIPTELITLEGVGHFIPLEKPMEVFTAMTSFFPIQHSIKA